MTTRQLTVEEILNGTGLGRMQSVGHMSVIPLIDEGNAQDDIFAPPDFNASTRDYGVVDVENRSDRPTIVPTGTGWVTEQYAQDHATPSAKLMKPNEKASIRQACCIQETQGGLIKSEQVDFVVLPAQVRVQALASRRDTNYSRLWPHLRKLRGDMGYSGSGDLASVLKHFKKELDEFVAEFELVPKQVGAVIMIGNKVVGIERAPTEQFWQRLWAPLVRVCYGSLSIKAHRMGMKLESNKVPMKVITKTLSGIRLALEEANEKAEKLRDKYVNSAKKMLLSASPLADSELNEYKIVTVANPKISGQIVGKSRSKISYASLCTS